MPHDHNAIERSIEDRQPELRMLPAEFKRLQESVGWSNRKVADRLGVSDSSIDKYRSGAVEIPGPVARLLPIIVTDELRNRRRKG